MNQGYYDFLVQYLHRLIGQRLTEKRSYAQFLSINVSPGYVMISWRRTLTSGYEYHQYNGSTIRRANPEHGLATLPSPLPAQIRTAYLCHVAQSSSYLSSVLWRYVLAAV